MYCSLIMLRGEIETNMIHSAVLGYCKVVCLETKTLLVRVLLSAVYSSMKRSHNASLPIVLFRCSI